MRLARYLAALTLLLVGGSAGASIAFGDSGPALTGTTSSPSAAVPSSSVSRGDDFNRPDSNPLDGNWDSAPGSYPMQIVSGQLANTNDTQTPSCNTVTSNGALWKDVLPSDLDVEVTVAAKGAAHEPVVITLLDQALNGQVTLAIYPVDQTIFLYGVDNPILYDYPSFPVNVGDRIGLRITGTTVEAMRNGAAIYTRTLPSSSVNQRRVEIGAHVECFNPAGPLRIDNFSVATPPSDPVISNEFPICGDQDGSEVPLVLNCPAYTPVPDQQILVVPGSGPVNVKFDMVWRLGIFSDEMLVVKVDDDQGSIDGLKPGDPGYLPALYKRAQILAPGPSSASSPDKVLSFNGGDRLVLMLVTTTLADLMANNPNNNPSYSGSAVAYFSFGQLNPDGQDHMLAWRNTDGSSQFAFEDWITNGGNFNDVGIDVSGIPGGTASPPAPQITDSPADTTNVTTASFSFTDSQAGVSFLCQLDASVFSSCSSPVSYTGLSEGSHTFSVEAKDTAHNLSPVTSYTWAIDLGPCTQADPNCTLIPEGSSSTEVVDPSLPAASDSLAPSGAATSAATSTSGTHCAWFKDDEPIDGKTKGIVFVIHQFTAHIEFHYCVVWGQKLTKVDGISVSNVYKKYPWVYRGLFGDPVVGGLGTPKVKVTASMNYQQCALKDLGCFDSRNIVLEATIDAKAKDHTHPVTVTVKSD